MSEAPSVRESLQAALAGSEATPEPVAATAPAEAAVQAEPAAAPVAEVPAASPARDATGKFAPKTTDTPAPAGAAEAATPPADTPTTETAQLAEKEPQTEAIPIPPSLSAAVKAQWADLPADVRKDFAKLEGTVQNAKAEWGRKGERLNRYDEIMAPRSEKLTLQGIDEFTAIKTLLAAQDFLERDPLGGIQHLARSYGVNLQALAQQAIGQQPGSHEAAQLAPHAPDLNAALQPLARQVQTLQQQLQAQSQATEAAQLAEARSAVDQFRNDPANLYFDNVRDDVAARLESGHAKTLAEAYEQATWANPEIRSLLLKAQTAPPPPAVDPAKKAAEDAQRKKAEAATKAAGSVTGAPTPGATAPKGAPGSIRDSLLAAAQETGFRV